jgi:hypothetical protein
MPRKTLYQLTDFADQQSVKGFDQQDLIGRVRPYNVREAVHDRWRARRALPR